MRTNRIMLLSLLVLAFIYSCGEKDTNQNSSSQETYELVIVDSLIVDELEELQVTDYNVKTKRFLAYGTNSKDCMEVDMEGNIINRVELSGEGPGRFGTDMNGLGYFGEDKFINGMGNYFVYDKDWNYKRKSPSTNYLIPVKYISQAPKDLAYLGKTVLVQAIEHTEYGRKLAPEYFSTAKMIELLEINEEAPLALIPYPEKSIYGSDKTYYWSHQPKFAVNEAENKLYLTLPLERKLYLYNLDDSFSLDKVIDLDLTGFTAPQGIPFNDQLKNSLKGFGPENELNYVYMMTNSSIQDISTHGKLTMLKHRTGVENKSITSYEEATGLARKDSRTINSFIIDGQVVYETEENFRYPIRIDEMRFMSPDLNEAEERDYNKFYIYELRTTNNR